MKPLLFFIFVVFELILLFNICVILVLLFLQCNPAGCLFELLLQLSVIMVGKQIFNNFIEVIVP